MAAEDKFEMMISPVSGSDVAILTSPGAKIVFMADADGQFSNKQIGILRRIEGVLNDNRDFIMNGLKARRHKYRPFTNNDGKTSCANCYAGPEDPIHQTEAK